MNVLLADDHPLFLDGLRSLLESRGIKVVGTARDGVEAVERARALHPDIVLLDIRMPRMDGLTALRQIKSELPDVKVVMLTISAADEELFCAMKEGACGYLLKTQHTEEILALLYDVERGEAALSPGLARRILSELSRCAPEVPADQGLPRQALSPREVQVLGLVARGLTYKEVGAKLFLSERTIKYHMGEIVSRLHAHNRLEAIDYARRAGLIV